MKKLAIAATILFVLASGAAYSQGQFTSVVGSKTVSALPTNRVAIVIAAGNTFQTVLAVSASRRSLTIQNNNATDSCWLDFGSAPAFPPAVGVPITAGTATKAGAELLLPGGSLSRYYPYVPSDELEATCATTGDTMRIEYQ